MYCFDALDSDYLTFTKVTKDHLIFKNKLSPYEGMKLTGRVDTTYVRGRAVWCLQDKTASLQPIGELL